MPKGVDVFLAGGVAVIEFADPAARGPGLAALLKAGGPSGVRKSTAGVRPAYIVAEEVARAAGLLDDPTPVRAQVPPDEPVKPPVKRSRAHHKPDPETAG
jgi:hypothetical protein